MRSSTEQLSLSIPRNHCCVLIKKTLSYYFHVLCSMRKLLISYGTFVTVNPQFFNIRVLTSLLGSHLSPFISTHSPYTIYTSLPIFHLSLYQLYFYITRLHQYTGISPSSYYPLSSTQRVKTSLQVSHPSSYQISFYITRLHQSITASHFCPFLTTHFLLHTKSTLAHWIANFLL